MLTKKILKAVLNVKHIAIDDMKILPDGSFAIMVHPTKGEQCRCGICGRKSPCYDKGRRQRSWRTCDWNTNKVYIVADEPRVDCPEHGVVTAAVPWAMHNSRFTKEFEELATWLAMNCSKAAVASLLRISWNTIGPIISRMKNKLDPDPSKRFVGLVNIGVDETSYKKGHKYITVVINHDTGKVIWAHEGHGKTIFTKFFKLLTKEQLASIKLVSGDGAKWIQECMDEFCPQAERCIDPFHVVQWATEALDEVRREAWREAQKKAKAEPKRKPGRPTKDTPKKDTTAKDLKGSRYALGKAPEHLTEKQEAQLAFIAVSDKRLYRAYLLKEKLRLVFQCEDVETAKTELDGWIKWAQHCRIKVFVELQRKIRRHYDAILATMEYHLTNAVVEATNRKIKLSIYMAYGFRNIDNMLDMIMLRCSDIEVRLPWEHNPVLPVEA